MKAVGYGQVGSEAVSGRTRQTVSSVSIESHSVFGICRIFFCGQVSFLVSPFAVHSGLNTLEP